MEKVCIMGAGSWGTALALLLSDKGYDVHLYMRNASQIKEINETGKNAKYLGDIPIPKSINLSNNIKECVENSKAVIFAVSSQSTRSAMESVKSFIEKNTIAVNVSKGLEKNTNLRISQISKEILPQNPFVVLSGPSHAEEVAVKMPTTVVCASEDIISAQYIQDMFSNEYFRVYTNPDVIGVELGGALKNIIAFGTGIIDGLGYGDNTKAGIMTRGIAEITRLGVAMGASISTFAGLSGIGDLIVTCTSMHSRNRRAGILIGQGKTLEQTLDEISMVVEGITSTQVAYSLSKEYNIDMPITTEIYNVLYNDKKVEDSLNSLMTRTTKHESEETLYIKLDK